MNSRTNFRLQLQREQAAQEEVAESAMDVSCTMPIDIPVASNVTAITSNRSESWSSSGSKSKPSSAGSAFYSGKTIVHRGGSNLPPQIIHVRTYCVTSFILMSYLIWG